MFLCGLSTFSQRTQFIIVCVFWKKGTWPKVGESTDVSGLGLWLHGFTSDGVSCVPRGRGVRLPRRKGCTLEGGCQTPTTQAGVRRMGAVCAQQLRRAWGSHI